MSAPLKLFVKPGCPWCDMAEEWLRGHGYRYTLIDVISDRAAYDEMFRLSSQRRAPTLQVDDLVLPDFGPEELADFLKRHSIRPDAAEAQQRRV
ncbi:MAG: glutaredoxin family protein [Chthoniobacteraceae bacterium]